MKKLLVVSALVLLSGCTTTSPCYTVQTDNEAWQTGVVVTFGKGEPRKSTKDFVCPYQMNRDLFNPPLPFEAK